MCRFSRSEFVNGRPHFKSCAADSSAVGVFCICKPTFKSLLYFVSVSCFEINNPAGCRALKTDSCRGIQVPKAPSFILYFKLFSSDLNNETMKLCSI